MINGLILSLLRNVSISLLTDFSVLKYRTILKLGVKNKGLGNTYSEQHLTSLFEARYSAVASDHPCML